MLRLAASHLPFTGTTRQAPWHPTKAPDWDWKEDFMKAFRVVRNVLGTATMILAGYVFLESLIEARRYLRISTM